MVAAILEVEQAAKQANPDEVAAQATPARRWTLTWLEGRPVVELAPPPGSDDVTAIRFDPTSGAASIATGDPGEEWVEE